MLRPNSVRIQPSRVLLFISIIAFTLCLVSIVTANISGWFAVFLVITVIGYMAYLLRKYVFLCSADSIVEMSWQDDGWWLRQKSGQEIEVELRSASVITAQYSLLCFDSLDPESRPDFLKAHWFSAKCLTYFVPTYRVLLFFDSSDHESLRRMRVCALQAL